VRRQGESAAETLQALQQSADESAQEIRPLLASGAVSAIEALSGRLDASISL
jgi:hypothetical protein